MALEHLSIAGEGMTFDSGRKRGSSSQVDDNLVAVGGTDAGFGAAWDAAVSSTHTVIKMRPPRLLASKLLWFTTNADGTLLGPTRTTSVNLALNEGRISGAGRRQPSKPGATFEAVVSIDAASGIPNGHSAGLTFRVGLAEGRVGDVGAGQTVLGEETVTLGGPSKTLRVAIPPALGLQRPGLVSRLFLEVESVGDGLPLTGRWDRPRIGTVQELDEVQGTLAVTELHAVYTDTDPIPPADPAVGGGAWFRVTAPGVYANPPDAPLLSFLSYEIDGASVSDATTATPPSPPKVNVTAVSSGSGVYGGQPHQDQVYVPIFPWGTAPVAGWVGGMQPGESELVTFRSPVSLKPMGGDGDADASFAGVVAVLFDQEALAGPTFTSPITKIRTRVETAVNDRLLQILPAGSGRTGLTTAESMALRSEIDTIVAGAVAAEVAGLTGSTTYVGTVHHTYGLPELLAGTVNRTSEVTGSGSRYRITTAGIA